MHPVFFVLLLLNLQLYLTFGPFRPRHLGLEVRPVVDDVHVGVQLPGLHGPAVPLSGQLQALEPDGSAGVVVVVVMKQVFFFFSFLLSNCFFLWFCEKA